MPREFPRARRVGELLQRELATLLREQIDDPRALGVTVTGVDCTKDLSHARVHFSMLSDDPAAHQAARKALEGAAGAIRHALRERVVLRVLPTLSFHYDDSLARGARLEALIERAVAEDAAHAPAGSVGDGSGDE